MAISQRLVRSVLTLGTSQFLTMTGAAILTVLLPRYLGDANLGKLAFGLAMTQLAGLVADQGAATYLTKEVARNPANTPTLLVNALLMRIPLSLIAIAFSVAIVNVGDYDEVTRSIVYILAGGILLNSLLNIALGVLQGQQNMRWLAFCPLVTKLSYTGLTVGLLLSGAGVVEVAIATTASLVPGVLLSLWPLLSVLRRRRSLHPTFWRTIALGGLPFFVWQAALMIYGQVDTVMLSFMAPVAVVGWYAAAYRLVTVPIFVPTIIMMVAFPALAAASSTPAVFSAIARRSIHVVTLLCVPMALGLLLLTDRIIDLLGYPVEFRNSILPTAILALHIPIVGFDMILGSVLNTRDRQRQWAITGVSAAVLNPLLNLFAIPFTQETWGNGAIGAAATTTLTEIFMLVVGLRLLPAGVFGRETAAGTLRILGAAAVMGVVVWLARDLPIGFVIPLGAAIYAGAGLTTGAIRLADLREIREQLRWRRVVPDPAV